MAGGKLESPKVGEAAERWDYISFGKSEGKPSRPVSVRSGRGWNSRKVVEEFGLTAENCPSNGAFVTLPKWHAFFS